MGEPVTWTRKQSSQWVRGRTFMGVGGGERGRGAWMLRGLVHVAKKSWSPVLAWVLPAQPCP